MGELSVSEEKTTVYIVNHTHWDREWYFSIEDALALSDRLFTEAIEELERHPEVSFTLDGQISIVDDYLKIHPEMLQKIKTLISRNQLFIGPWYTQTDALHTQGESIIRNGMIGIYEARKYGQYMHIGYLPDTFGFNAQMPVILRQLDIDNFVFWRGFDPERVKSTYFKWLSLGNNSFVYAINMPQGYGTGMLLDATNAYVDRRLDPAVDFIKENSSSQKILIPSGNDQMNIINDFSDKISRINKMGKYFYKISDYPSFVQQVANMKGLNEYHGEFLEPMLARVHRTCGSSRMDIKIAASRLEQKLLTQVEPLAVIAKFSGIDIGNGLLIETWKKLLESQAHDSLAGSISDSVAEDVLHRLKEGNELAESIINTIEKLISNNLGLSHNDVLIFNTALHNFSGYKQIRVISKEKDIHFPKVRNTLILSQHYTEPRANALMQTEAGDQYCTELGYYISDLLIDVDLPALGYKVYSFEETLATERLQEVNDDKYMIQNSRLNIEFINQNVNIKMNDGKKIMDCIYLEDLSNAGDTYDFSPLPDDKTIELRFDTVKILSGGDYKTMILSGHYQLPLRLDDRLLKENYGNLEVKVSLTLIKDEEVIHVKAEINNQIFNHRLRLIVRTGIETTKSIASVPYGYLSRKSEEIQNWARKYVEKPVNVWPLHNNVTLSSNEKSVTIFSNDIFEFEHEQDKIALTLLATTDQLGKPDLIYRPGRASGDTTKVGHIMMPTPKAQLIGQLSMNLDIRFSSSEFDQDETEYLRSLMSLKTPNYQRQEMNLFMNRLDNKIQNFQVSRQNTNKLTVLSLPEVIHVAACYPSYYNPHSFIVRLENVTANPVDLDKRILKNYQFRVINALEKDIDQNLQIPAMDVLTLELKNYE